MVGHSARMYMVYLRRCTVYADSRAYYHYCYYYGRIILWAKQDDARETTTDATWLLVRIFITFFSFSNNVTARVQYIIHRYELLLARIHIIILLFLLLILLPLRLLLLLQKRTVHYFYETLVHVECMRTHVYIILFFFFFMGGLESRKTEPPQSNIIRTVAVVIQTA